MQENEAGMGNKQKKRMLDSIKIKLVAMISFIVIVPIVVISLVSTGINRKNSVEHTITINEAQASFVTYNISATVDENMRALETLAASPYTIDYMKGTPEEPGAEKKLLNQIQTVDEDFKDGNVIAITGADGMQLLKSSGELVDVSEREYFKRAMAGEEYVSDVQVSKSNGSLICTFAVPVKDEKGTVIGILQRNYNLTVFREMLTSEIIEDQQDLLIADNMGMIIAHSSHEIDPEALEDQSANPFYTDSRGDKTSGDYTTVWDGKKWMVSWVKEAKTGWVVASCRVSKVALRAVNISANIIIGLGIAFVVVFGFVAYVISQSFTKPIHEIDASMEALANGRFLEISSFRDRKDEFGDIVREINSVIIKLRQIVSNIKNSAISVNDSSNTVADISEKITQTSQNVTSAVQEIAGSASQQADEIQGVVENTAIISNNIQTVSENAVSVAQTAGIMSGNSVDSKNQLDKLKVSSDEMSKAIMEITEKISATESAVERIGGKVEAIDAIASQTNLLALNASIEAARAGEVGKGFAVVAEEIGKLAEESAQSANEIRMEMDLLLKESKSAVEMSKKVNAITEVDQKAILKDTISSIENLIHGIEVSVEGIELINVSAKKCEESKKGVTDSIGSLSSISEENAAASEETATTIEQLESVVTSLAEDSKTLRGISDSLLHDIKFFED